MPVKSSHAHAMHAAWILQIDMINQAKIALLLYMIT